VFQEVACLERGALRPDTLGLSLAEARSILAGVEQTTAERQAAQVCGPSATASPLWTPARVQRSPSNRVSHPPFGKLKLDSPRLYQCPCEPPGPKTFSPLAEMLPERTSPKLVYLDTKFAVLVSYGLTVKLLEGAVADC
jgi:hypothetical protein